MDVDGPVGHQLPCLVFLYRYLSQDMKSRNVVVDCRDLVERFDYDSWHIFAQLPREDDQIPAEFFLATDTEKKRKFEQMIYLRKSKKFKLTIQR